MARLAAQIVRYPVGPVYKQVREDFFDLEAALRRLLEVPAEEHGYVWTAGCEAIEPDEAKHLLNIR